MALFSISNFFSYGELLKMEMTVCVCGWTLIIQFVLSTVTKTVVGVLSCGLSYGCMVAVWP